MKEKIKVADIVAKKVLNVNDLKAYTGWSRSHIYKLTHKRIIPFSKPNGKEIFFNREEIENYLMSNRILTAAETERAAERLARR